MRSTLQLLLLSLLPTLAAAQPTDPPAKAPSEPIAKQPASDLQPPLVTLLDPGAEPRQTLRLAPAKDLLQISRLRMVMSTTSILNGEQLRDPILPVMSVIMRFAVKEVSPEGDITYETRIASYDIEETKDTPAELVNAMRSALEPATGIFGTCTVSSRGINREIKLEVPKGNPQLAGVLSGLRDQVGQLSIPFPEEPIGPGGKWKVDMTILNQGMRIAQTMTCTLKEVKDGTAHLDVSVDQKGDKQQVSNATLPPNTKLSLESLHSTGNGTIELPLNRLMPTNSQMKVATECHMKLGEGQAASALKQDIKVEVTVTDVKPGDLPTKN